MTLEFSLDSKVKNRENVYYDTESNSGVVILTKSSDFVDDLQNNESYDVIVHLNDSVFIKGVRVGNYVACEVLKDFVTILPKIKTNIFLYRNGSWVYLRNSSVYTLEIENSRRQMWIGEEFTFEDMKENTCLCTVLLKEPNAGILEHVQIAYARCKLSMLFLDDLHREYIANLPFTKDANIHNCIAVKAVAGSGKTTTILNLAKKHSKKRLLYLAFNKSLVTDIVSKLDKNGIRNMEVRTFDSLLYKTYTDIKGHNPNLTDINPQTMLNIYPWFQGKAHKTRKYYSKKFIEFCGNPLYSSIEKYCKEVLKEDKPILKQLWDKVLNGSLCSFETIRKFCFMEHWFRNSIDSLYDIIMIDEVQDFDLLMLRMILDDTTIPKLFVGDPRQAIYEWRGCINAFEYMPKNASLVVEFYSTFRIGDPACDEICAKFKDCWMVSKSTNQTVFGKIKDGDSYVYLFRSWRRLLEIARNTQNMWIYSFDTKIVQMRKLHEKLQYSKSDDDDMEFEDDLPNFLRSITREELESLIHDIEANMVAEKTSLYKFYTVHSYKGMENAIVRIADDVNGKESPNIQYVALTRGMKKICEDPTTATATILQNNTKQSSKNKTIAKENDITDMLIGSMSNTPQNLKQSSTSRVKSWTKEEDDLLLDLVGKQTEYDIIIEKLGRSILAIEIRLNKLAYDLYLEGENISDISLKFGISTESFESYIKEQNVKKDAIRKGVRWDETEISKMLTSVSQKRAFSDIACEHQRTTGSIESKLKELSVGYYEEGLTIADIECRTGLSERTIIDNLIRSAKNSKKTVSEDNQTA
jgi:hypothetical protein